VIIQHYVIKFVSDLSTPTQGEEYNIMSVTCGIVTGRWVSLGPLVSSTNKTELHDITEILLQLVLITIKPTHQPT